MTVEVRIAVARKVLAACSYSLLLQALDEGTRMPGDDGWLPCETAVTDDWILGIGVNVHDGREVPREAQAGEAPTDPFPGTTCQVGIILLPKPTHRRQPLERGGKPANYPSFFVESNQSGQPRTKCLPDLMTQVPGGWKVRQIAP